MPRQICIPDRLNNSSTPGLTVLLSTAGTTFSAVSGGQLSKLPPASRISASLSTLWNVRLLNGSLLIAKTLKPALVVSGATAETTSVDSVFSVFSSIPAF